MLSSFRQTILRFNLLTSNDRVVTGISGGADSIALLHALITIKNEFPLTLYAVHVNHHLRDQAQGDEDFVAALCKQWQIPLRIFHVQVREEQKGKTIEETARNLRYDCFQTALREYNATKIATAHNRDDHTETVLLNLIRGAGLKGLCGIPAFRMLGEKGSIIRPLLETPRSVIETYLCENNLSYRTDETNADETYRRNRIRHSVLPLITAHINPHASEVIARNANLLRDDEAYLQTMAQESFLKCKDGNGLDIKKLLALPISLQRRVIRIAATFLSPTSGKHAKFQDWSIDIHSHHIEQLIDLAHGETGREIYLRNHVRVRREYNRLIFFHPMENKTDGFYYALKFEEPIFIPEMNKTVLLTFFKPQNPCNDCFKAFSYDRVRTSLSIRTRRLGDRIFFSGVGTRKLQDYFTDNKIPRIQRNQIPLLADGNNIVWIMDKYNRINSHYESNEINRVFWFNIY